MAAASACPPLEGAESEGEGKGSMFTFTLPITLGNGNMVIDKTRQPIDSAIDLIA